MRPLLFSMILACRCLAQSLTPDEVFEKLYQDRPVSVGSAGSASGPLADADDAFSLPSAEIEPIEPFYDKFADLAKLYERTLSEGQRPVALEMEKVMDDIYRLSSTSFDLCKRTVNYYSDHIKVIGQQSGMLGKLNYQLRLYQRNALSLAHGPADLEALRTFCEETGLRTEATEVATILGRIQRGTEKTDRTKARTKREEARKEVSVLLDGLSSSAADEMDTVVRWMEKKSYGPPAARERLMTIAAVLGIRPIDLKPLLERVDTLKGSDVAGLEASFLDQLEKNAAITLRKLLGAAKKCETAGEWGLATVLYEAVLNIDPENEKAHAVFGRTLVGKRWLDPYSASMDGHGLVWDSECGFRPKDSDDKRSQGLVYDPPARSWRPIEEADAAHGTKDDPWVVETAHFVITSTAGIKATAALADRLEAYLLLVFRQLDAFFDWKRGTLPALSAKLPIRLCRLKEQLPDPKVAEGEIHAVYSISDKETWCWIGSNESFSYRDVQNAVLRQIFVQCAGGSGEPWLVEGALAFVDRAFPRGRRLSVGPLSRNSLVSEYKKLLSQGELPLEDVLRITAVKGFRGGEDKARRGVAATFFFLMHMDSGRYKADVLQMLRESIEGRPVAIEGYTGLTAPTLAYLMQRFYQVIPADY